MARVGRAAARAPLPIMVYIQAAALLIEGLIPWIPFIVVPTDARLSPAADGVHTEKVDGSAEHWAIEAHRVFKLVCKQSI